LRRSSRGGFSGAAQGGVPERRRCLFENVGVPVFDAVLPLFNTFARIPVAG